MLSFGSAGPGSRNLLKPNNNLYAQEVQNGLLVSGAVSGNNYIRLTYVVYDYDNSGAGWNIYDAKLLSEGILTREEFRAASKTAHIGAFASMSGNVISVYLAFDPETGDIYVQSINSGANQRRYINDLKSSNYYKASCNFLKENIPIDLDISLFDELFKFIVIGFFVALSIVPVYIGWRKLQSFLN